MDKNEFLKELENKIRVLDKSEIKDILAEYSQHIEMRMASGLSEEEAIKNFGDMDDLAAEILEAYHVNPDFSDESRNENKKKAISAMNGIKSIFTGTFKGIKSAFMKLGKGIKYLFIHFIGAFTALGTTLKRIFSKKNRASELPKPDETANAAVRKEKNKTMGRCKKVISGISFICLAILVILCLIPVTIAGGITIFGTGTLLVLLFQGYPVIGILIFCVGAAVMSVSLWLLLASLIWKGNKPEEEADIISEEEEQ